MNNEEKMELINKGIKIGKEHSTPSPETKKITKNIMDNQDLIIKTISEMKLEFRQLLGEMKDDNASQHTEIIKRQDHTNGSIASAQKDIYRIKSKQSSLRMKITTVCITVLVVLTILGFMPERIYNILTNL